MPSPAEINNFLLLTGEKTVTQLPSTTASPQSPLENDKGIDTVEVTFPINPDFCNLSSEFWQKAGAGNDRKSGVEYSYHHGELRIGFGTVVVRLHTASLKCTLRFNAARQITPKSRYLLPADALQTLTGKIVDALQPYVWASFDEINEVDGTIHRAPDWASHVQIRRLDIALNMVVQYWPMLQEALPKRKPVNAKYLTIDFDFKDGWTLSNKTKSSGCDRIYNKGAELRASGINMDIDEGNTLVRFETQIMKDRLKTLGLTRLSDISEESIATALEHRWNKSRWNVEIAPNNSLLPAISVLTEKHQGELINYLFMMSEGRSDRFTKAQHRRLRPMAEDLGLTPGLPLSRLGKPEFRLDLHHGGLIPV